MTAAEVDDLEDQITRASVPLAQAPRVRPGEWRLIDDAPGYIGPKQYFRWSGRPDEEIEVRWEDDIEDEIEANKAEQNWNDGYSPTRTIRRVASIPASIRLKWLLEEGWDHLDPANQKRLRKKLNDPEWRWLRTAPGRL